MERQKEREEAETRRDRWPETMRQREKREWGRGNKKDRIRIFFLKGGGGALITDKRGAYCKVERDTSQIGTRALTGDEKRHLKLSK